MLYITSLYNKTHANYGVIDEYEIRLVDNKYAVSLCPKDGYVFPAKFWGSARDIAKELLFNYLYTNDGYGGYSTWPINIDFGSDPIKCSMPYCKGIDGIDIFQVAQEIEAEINKLKILIPFA